MINRRKFIGQTGLAAGLLAVSSHRLLADMLLADGYTFKNIRNNIGIFTEAGGTIGWMNGKDGFVVVDAQFPHSAPHLIAELRKKEDNVFRYLINTHHHGDHTSGNIAFKDIVEEVVAHQNAVANQKRSAINNKKEDQQLYAGTTFTDKWHKKTGGESVRCHYFGSAHTDGDIIVHFEDTNVAHMGDLVFNRRYPYIDRSAGASIKNWINVLEKTQKQFDTDTLFIFGHAYDPEKITGDLADLKAKQHFLEQLLSCVKNGISAGKTKEEILKTPTIPGNTEWKGKGIERCLEAAYGELTEE